jgi:outer membrane biosynthesis protein TonB
MLLRPLLACGLLCLGSGSLGGHEPSKGSPAPVVRDFARLRVLQRPPWPRYPRAAKLAGLQGEVRVAIVLGADGLPVMARALDGPRELKAEGESYAMGWTFEPVKVDGRAVVASSTLTASFRLPDPGTASANQVTLSLEAADPRLAGILDEVTCQVSRQIRKCGLIQVPVAGADPRRTFSLVIRILPQVDGDDAPSLLLGTLAPLKDQPPAAKEAEAPVKEWRSRQAIRLPEGGADARKVDREAALGSLVESLFHQAGLGDDPEPPPLSYARAGAVTGVGIAVGAPAHALGGAGTDPQALAVRDTDMKVKVQPPMPPYPPLARIARIQGTVVVELVVGADGLPSSARAIEGPPQLRFVAEGYAMKWQFEPMVLQGSPQVVRFRMTMPFRLVGGAKVQVQRVVVETVAADPSLESLLPGLADEAGATLKRLGVKRVQGPSGDGEPTHHLRIEVARPGHGGSGLRLSLRFCLLTDLQAAVAAGKQPRTVRIWAYELLLGAHPAQAVQEELRKALLDTVAIQEGAPRPLQGPGAP